ncbi:MAG: glycosyltransferase [Chitinophagaceae bacterium]
MGSPIISVILPAYNCERFIQAAVDSVLGQTFRDFELLIIDDGSTDHTAALVRGIADQRIRLIRNEKNLGLVDTLNKGIDLAKGEYIARMDGDDLCRPDRFAIQLAHLQALSYPALLTATAQLIDEDGLDIGVWKDDVRHTTPPAIRHYLPKNNCIVHPAVMAPAALFRHYRYLVRQKQSEDYDLWLRMAADGISLEKIAAPLLRHRILQQSFTRRRQRNVFFKLAGTKLVFVAMAAGRGKLNGFVLKTMWYGLTDVAKGCGKWLSSIFKRS